MSRFLRAVWESFKEVIVLFLIILISLGFLTKSDSPSVKNFRAFLFGGFSALSSVVNYFVPSQSYKTEAEYLRNRNAELMLENNKLRRFALSGEDLRFLSKFETSSEHKLLSAKIIQKSLANSQYTFTLNKGSKDGVCTGLPVLVDAGLIGVIALVSNDYSVVNTVKSAELRLIVQEERTRYEGIMRWNGSQLLVANLPKTADIRVGDKFVTSSSSSIVSEPCSVGKVKKILNPESGNLYIVEVDPAANLDRSEFVFVMLDYKPQKNFIQPKK